METRDRWTRWGLMALVIVGVGAVGVGVYGVTVAGDGSETARASSTFLAAESEGIPEALQAPAPGVMRVFKTETCGCCALWVDHMREHGFELAVEDVEPAELFRVKSRLGVTREMGSCHTAVLGDYVFEGHVPADVIRQFLEEAPEAAGLAVPGMPMGSPGMEGPYSDPYDILAFTRNGRTSVFASR